MLVVLPVIAHSNSILQRNYICHECGTTGIWRYGGTTVNNNFSAFQNPSLLVFTNGPSLGLSVENKFLTKRITVLSFSG